MSAPIWIDLEITSTLIVGEGRPRVVVTVEEWPRHPGWWAVAVFVGTGPQALSVYGSGHKAPGHSSREAAKAAGMEGLSAWLRQVAEQTSAAMAGGGR